MSVEPSSRASAARHAAQRLGQLVLLSVAAIVAAVVLSLQIGTAERMNWNDFGTFHRAACGGQALS